MQKLAEGDKSPSDPLPMLMRLGHHCSDQEKNAEAAERELIRIKLLHHMSKHIGQSFEAVVTKVHPDGLYARGLKLPAEGYVSTDKLPRDKYRFEKRTHSLQGFREGNTFRLGDRLTVQIEKVDIQRRELFYSVMKNHSVVKSDRRITTGKKKSKKQEKLQNRRGRKKRKFR